MAFERHVWDQLRSITAGDLAPALERDGWARDTKGGSQYIYWKAGRRVSIHMHPQKTYGAGMLKALLADIGWSVEDLHRLKLVK